MVRERGMGLLAGVLLSAFTMLAGGCATMSAADTSASHLARTLRQQELKKSSLVEEAGRPAASEGMTAERLESMGDYYRMQQNLTLAFINYNKALRLDPGRSALRLKVGQLYLGKGLLDEAEEMFLVALNENPEDARVHMGLGQTYFMQERFEESETHLRIALEQDEKLWEAYNYLGMLYNRQGRIDEALREFAGAMALQPESGMLYNNLGVSFLLAKQYGRAVRAFEQALQLGNVQQRTYNNLALALAKTGDYDHALEVFRSGGSVAKAYNNVGYLLLLEKRYDQAVEALEKAMEKSPSFYVRASANMKRAQTEAGLQKGEGN